MTIDFIFNYLCEYMYVWWSVCISDIRVQLAVCHALSSLLWGRPQFWTSLIEPHCKYTGYFLQCHYFGHFHTHTCDLRLSKIIWPFTVDHVNHINYVYRVIKLERQNALLSYFTIVLQPRNVPQTLSRLSQVLWTCDICVFHSL